MKQNSAFKEPNRAYYLDGLRICAIAAVVMIHVAAMAFAYWPLETFGWAVCNVFDGCSRWSVPVFVMISGALLLAPQRTATIKDIWGKRIKKILILFIVWSSVYLIVLGDHSTLRMTIDSFFGGYYHLWFLWMIIIVYACIPFLKKIVETPCIAWYFIGISFVCMSIVPYIVDWWGPGSIMQTYLLAEGGFPVGFTAYFVLGYLLSTTSVSRILRRISYIGAVIGCVATLGLTQWLSNEQGYFYGNYYEYFSPTVLLTAVGVFIYAKTHWMMLYTSINTKQTIINISKYTLGIYLIHIIILELLDKIEFNTTIGNPIWSIPLVWLSVFLISLSVTVVLSKIPIIRTYCI